MSAEHKISPLAPKALPTLPKIAGVKLATAECNIRYKGRKDVALAVVPAGATIAGVLTRSKTSAAPVDWCRKNLGRGKVRAVLINAGNANAFTGTAGEAFVASTVAAAASEAGCPPDQVSVASTGVIGQPLPANALAAHLPAAFKTVSDAGWEAAARAIMTTDTFPKGATATATIDGRQVRINGFAKGSGMIAPDMATMLAFLFTDAAIEGPVLQKLLAAATDRSFNCITVDSDTSTSDTLLCAATGKAGNRSILDPTDPRAADFVRALEAVCLDLAHQVVRDGEGAQKFIQIKVTGAEHDAAARRVGLVVANSPLVKTAIAGEDANWGRIVMAVGKAGERAIRDSLVIAIGGVQICADGMQVPGYDEAPVARHMKGQNIEIEIDLGVGSGQATVWTCDLTHGYIDINGSYRS
jgi:glutamate N-acetyltransferase/amino-acid N-acetyltransferase